ncbi:methyl-accepting chemotaxis sensory transducer with Cache sensor [Clostridium cavendishii DSM 21758]|uniref:Methyl-accepting chemotaxis sensory transducer with Cache sensor n=1 Tax=Clostridium cavendishii DSM 21758 TaxID=1121302 RepID=A0A1M6GIA8_9CLOT|nr:methyl-accepting chemotaxis protein [Clostridium cavendishii]SHJ09658.1 methyl-accepting chemotaxis sensory transducer with Cache sensor [Clostridium cavendishii DSM 21758]
MRKERKKQKLRNQLLKRVLLIAIIPMIFISVVAGTNVYKQSTQKYESDMKDSASDINSTITHFFEQNEKILNQMEANSVIRNTTNNDDSSKINCDIRKTSKANTELTNVYFSDQFKRTIMANVDGDQGDCTQYPWYKQTIEKDGKIAWFNVYKDLTTKQDMITACKAIKNDYSAVIGVVGVDMNLKSLTNKFKDFKVGKTGEIIITDQTGIVMYSNDEKIIGKNINPDRSKSTKDINGEDEKFEDANLAGTSELFKTAKSNDSKFVDLNFNGENKKVLTMSNPKSSWNTFVIVDKSEVNSAIFTTLRVMLILTILTIIVSIVLVYRNANKIVNPLILLSNNMKKCAEGDLNVQCKIDFNNEIGELADSFNNMVLDIKKLVTTIKDSSLGIIENSSDMNNKTEELVTSSGFISNIVASISNGAQAQASSLQNSLSTTEDFKNALGELTSYKNNFDSVKEDMTVNNKEAISAINDLKAKNSETIDGVKVIEETIEMLIRQAESIGKIVDTITGISEQTNLLALNAAIESARAGEAGKGFSVVAEEIRKLAEQSSEQANTIRQIIQDVKNITTTVADNMKDVSDNVSIQNKSVMITSNSFEKLELSIREIVNITRKFGNIIDSMNNSSKVLVDSIGEIAAVSEENAASSQEVTASIENQLEDINKIKGQTDILMNVSSEFENVITKFKI